MATLKHIASKNASYAEIQRYLMFEHDEDTNKPILVQRFINILSLLSSIFS